MRYAYIEANRDNYKIVRLCEALNVSANGYYDWRKRSASPRQLENTRLTAKIIDFHEASRKTYGSPRIHADLRAAGERCGVHRVARLMKRQGIVAKTAKRFVVTTHSKSSAPAETDKLQRQFHVRRKNEAWVCDTTFIGTRQGWLFLATVLDLYSRQVVGWSMSTANNTQLVSDALIMAMARRDDFKGCIVHSDQGSTYTSQQYRQLIIDAGMRCSMARRGECLDNAVAESFFGTLKTELTDDEDYRTRAQARQSIFDYIEIFYNRTRRHSFIDYRTPWEFEQQLVANL